jgi:phosphatidylglycerol:prolipoprotein diacylglycerol transferase
LPLFDLVAVYAPLFQSIARLGCLMAGCCYGCPTTMSWAISIDGMYVHPTQLYSSILLFGIFIILYTFKYQWARRPGLLITRYLMLASAERFIIEFWRSNPQIIGIWFLHYLSIQQWIALALFCTAGVFFKIRRYYYEHA